MASAPLTQDLPHARADWQGIFDPDTRIFIDPEAVLLRWGDIEPLLDIAPFGVRASGPPATVAQAMPSLPEDLARAVASLATRFAALMNCDTVRVRLEGVTGNACRKVHADYTDLRLICTLAGPGTEYTLDDDPDSPLQQVPTGAVALFKGHEFDPDHAACLHRSPPIEGTDARRLVLVIDTPQKPRTDQPAMVRVAATGKLG